MRSAVSEYELVAADSLPSALKLLAGGEGWRPMAGGTDLMVLLNAGRLPLRRLVSIRQIDELRQMKVSEQSIAIGASVTYTQIRNDALLQTEFPLLCQAANWTGGVANQNQGTLGGNIANASPAGDSTPPLLVHDATIVLASSKGTRSVAYADFHLGYKRTAMRFDELIVAIQLPRREQRWRYQGRKVGTRSAQAISKVSFAGAAHMEQGRVSDIRIALGSVAPVPLRCFATESYLVGRRLTQDLVSDARKVLATEIVPISDVRSTAAYRSQVAQNLLGAVPGKSRVTIEDFNTAGETIARPTLLQCCASSRWAQQMIQQRPFVDLPALLASADETWWMLEPGDWLEAFAAHPKIGESKLSEWCSREQRGVLSEPAEILKRLAKGNQRYLDRFGWVFLVNASGKSGSQMLEQLESRLLNNRDEELRIAAREQAQITALRLNGLFPE